MTLAPRGVLTSLLRIFTPIIMVVLAIVVASTLALLTGNNPLSVIETIVVGAFGSMTGLRETLNLAAILALTGMSALITFKCGVWNIGSEGQLYMGAIGATLVGLSQVGASTERLAFALVASVGFGCFWGFIPGVLKARFRVDEVVTTILMNYTALVVVDYLVASPLKDPTIMYDASREIPLSVQLPSILATGVNVGIILAVAIAIALYVVVEKTTLGFEIGLVGGNPMAAHYAGTNVRRTIIVSMIIGGGLAGLAGGLLLTGQSFRLFDGISESYGYIGVGVAMIAGLASLATIPSGIFFSMLFIGGVVMQRDLGIPFAYAQAFMAIVILVTTLRTILAKKVIRI